MYSSRICSKTVDALYLRAEQLERRWANAGLAIDFRDRMIDAVCGFLDKNPHLLVHPRGAAKLLSDFWTRSARRDAVRAANRPAVFSLSELDVPVPAEQLQDDDWLLKGSRAVLVEAGLRVEVAEAFLQRALLGDPEEVVAAVTHHCGVHPTSDTLRQWKHRYFAYAAQVLRNNASRLGLTTTDRHERLDGWASQEQVLASAQAH